ncbi:MAG: hypothetical protein GYB35_14975 [Algicola sp.]|nr:hypothetical protein [Algicola sp.]
MEFKNKSLIKKIFISFFFFALFNCKSTKEINELSSQINCKKKIYFVWDDESNYAKFDRTGNFNYLGKGKKPNLKEIFINTINDINKNYEGDYTYAEHRGFPSDSVIFVTVKLKKVIWDMGFSKVVTDMQLTYSTNENELGLIGSSFGYNGDKRYMKCFEDATLQFIIANCNN